ncbi:hypothetical protein SAMN05216525_1246 [Bradyrhizobium sp. Gha]|nr:hypothetical protein SAMN05216525_1246 [Bradyrhizobium sp. Gha]
MQPDAPVSQSAPELVQQERAAAESQPEAAAGSVHAAAALRPEAAVGSVHAAAALRPEAAAGSVHAAAELRPEAAVGSVHAAAAPQPGAASAAWVLQAVVGAAEAPDGSQAAGVAVSGVTARRPAEVRRADAAVQLPAAARWVPWARQVAARSDARAVLPLALPSAAASAFRQGPSLEAGPARRRAARFAHAMRSLRIASRSEPSWQAARSEDWSCREIPRKVL